MGHRIQLQLSVETVSAFTSVAGYAGPSSSLQTTPEVPVLLPEVQTRSGVQHLVCDFSLMQLMALVNCRELTRGRRACDLTGAAVTTLRNAVEHMEGLAILCNGSA
jgi:hypothetical protein